MPEHAIGPYEVCWHCGRESERRLAEHIQSLMVERDRYKKALEEIGAYRHLRPHIEDYEVRFALLVEVQDIVERALYENQPPSATMADPDDLPFE